MCHRLLRALSVRAQLRMHGRTGLLLRAHQTLFQYTRGVGCVGGLHTWLPTGIGSAANAPYKEGKPGMDRKKPRLGVFKFASCDGCQLSLLDCEDELLGVAGAVDIAYFLEATRKPLVGDFDLTLVEGSISS